jgi:hypothetical protein
MPLATPDRERLRKDFLARASAAFDAMFDDDQQEQLITLTEREDRVLQKGAELQAWLLERHLALDPLANPKEGESLRCPRCRSMGAPDTEDIEPVPRSLKTRAGGQELRRRKWRCPSCKAVFFPPGR